MKEFKDIVERLRALGFEAKINETEIQRPANLGPAKDYAELDEKEFRRVIDRVDDLETLAGIANRRKILGIISLKKYSPVQRSIIMERKLKLEQRDRLRNGPKGRAKAR